MGLQGQRCFEGGVKVCARVRAPLLKRAGHAVTNPTNRSSVQDAIERGMHGPPERKTRHVAGVRHTRSRQRRQSFGASTSWRVGNCCARLAQRLASKRVSSRLRQPGAPCGLFALGLLLAMAKAVVRSLLGCRWPARPLCCLDSPLLCCLDSPLLCCLDRPSAACAFISCALTLCSIAALLAGRGPGVKPCGGGAAGQGRGGGPGCAAYERGVGAGALSIGCPSGVARPLAVAVASQPPTRAKLPLPASSTHLSTG